MPRPRPPSSRLRASRPRASAIRPRWWTELYRVVSMLTEQRAEDDRQMPIRYDPDHPDANEHGLRYVEGPSIAVGT